MEKNRDWKFIAGTVILVAVLAVMTAFFWRTVVQQAALVKEEEAKEKQNAIEAIYIYQGDVLKTGVYVDMKTEQVFKADVPVEGIYNRNGKLIAGDILEEGDEVRIYGKQVFSQDDPPVLSGITKMERMGRATLEEAVIYREIVNQEDETEGPEESHREIVNQDAVPEEPEGSPLAVSSD